MKKILVVFDGAHYPTATLDLALQLNYTERIMLTGIFLPSVDYAEAMSYYYYGNAIAPLYLEEYQDDPKAIQHNVDLFETFCREHHLSHRIHRDIKKKVVQELQYETRFADLLILSSTHFYENLGTMIQEDYITDTLHKAECPILLLPGEYTPPQNIIFAYDGSASSMHAIKQFIYLMPQYTDLDTLFVYADDKKDDIPFIELVREYATQHFSKLAYYKLNADPKKYFNTWMEDRGASLLVSGAFGRSAFSELFRRNFLETTLKEQQIPLFISHL